MSASREVGAEALVGPAARVPCAATALGLTSTATAGHLERSGRPRITQAAFLAPAPDSSAS